MMLRFLLAVVVAVAPGAGALAQPTAVSGRATVIDGATLEIAGRRIRLAGIAAAADDHVCTRTDDERWVCGPRALNALEALLEETDVSCMLVPAKATDATEARGATGDVPHGVCLARGTDLSLWLLREGLATVADGDAHIGYRAAEAEARAARRGLWATPPR